MIDEFLGKTFKVLRTTKQIEAKALANEAISYSQLLKFEQGKTSITVEKLNYLLNACSISFDEFEYSYHELADTARLVFKRQIQIAFWHGDISRLEKLIELLNKQLETEPESLKIQLNKIEAEGALNFISNYYSHHMIPKKDLTILYNYLFKIKQWGKYECYLLMNCISLLTDKQVKELIHRMLHPEMNVLEAHRLESGMHAALLSAIRQMIAHQQFEPIHEWLAYLEEHVLPDFNMYERAMLTYLKTLYKFRLSPSQDTLSAVEKCIDAFKTLECFGIANIASEELVRYRKESHI